MIMSEKKKKISKQNSINPPPKTSPILLGEAYRVSSHLKMAKVLLTLMNTVEARADKSYFRMGSYRVAKLT